MTCRPAVIGLGFSSAATQLVLMRELLGVFQGNELILGVLLGNWLLLTGLGAWLGQWAGAAQGQTRPAVWPCGRIGWLAMFQLWIALVPFAQVLAVRLGYPAVFVRGAVLGLDDAVWSSLVVFAPYALASGCLLTRASRWAGESDAARGATRVYLADCIGSVFGGALVTFALVPWLDHLALLVVPAVGNLFLAERTLRQAGGVVGARLTVGLALGLAAGVAVADPDARTAAWQARPDRVVHRTQSPYGRLVVTESDGQLNFIENGLPLLSSHQVERTEEIVHMAMAQRPSAQAVLLLSGALSGTVGEVLKYGVTNVTCVELDPAILEAGRRLLPERLADGRVRVVATDGRRYVQRTASRYDVVIVDMPAPATAQLNRFYTAEFFAELKRVLQPDGVVVFGLGAYDNYISPELARELASAARTLRQSFLEVLLLPASQVWHLGSDGPLTPAVATRLEEARVATQWMRRSYLDAMLTPERLAAVRSAADEPAPSNTDFRPALYLLHLRRWLSQFDVWWGAGAGLLGLAAVICSSGLRGPGVALFSAGFAGASLEVVLLLGFQVLYGSLYRQVGLVLTVFMAGLAAGVWLAESAGFGRTRPALSAVVLLIAAYGLALPWALRGLGWASAAGLPSAIGQGAMAILTAVLAVLVGLAFPLAGRLEEAKPRSLAARMFAADYLGACVGAMVAGAVLVPLLGVGGACGVTAGLNLLARLCLRLKGPVGCSLALGFSHDNRQSTPR